jgi:glycosyltransferase involved in cell wall biosynthesis
VKIAFAHDHVFYVDENLNFYSSGKLPYKVWERYLKVFRELVVISRFKNIDDAVNIRRLNLSSGENVNFAPVSNINSLKGILNRKEVKKVIANTLQGCDALIARLPSEIGLLSISIAKQLNLPYAIELVGDPFNALWYHGKFIGKMYAPIISYRVKKTVKDCNFVLYVTREYLQKKYPTNGYIESCSNVEIDTQFADILHNRIKKIEANKSKIVLGLIGSLNSKYKGIDTAIKALSYIEKELPTVQLRILGNGNQDKWKTLAKELGMENRIIFDGVLPAGEAVYQWLDQIDLYIQPSLTEGLPRALIEAMSRGCPAIGSRVGGIPELLQEDCMHNPKNYKELGKLILNSLNQDWMKEQAQRNFHVAKNYYKDVLDRKRTMFWEKFREFCENKQKV